METNQTSTLACLYLAKNKPTRKLLERTLWKRGRNNYNSNTELSVLQCNLSVVGLGLQAIASGSDQSYWNYGQKSKIPQNNPLLSTNLKC